MLNAVALSHTLKVAYMELLLAEPEIIAQFTPHEQRELLITMLQHHEQREQLIDTYSITTLQTSTLAVGRVLHHEAVFNPIDLRVEQFLRDSTYNDDLICWLYRTSCLMQRHARSRRLSSQLVASRNNNPFLMIQIAREGHRTYRFTDTRIVPLQNYPVEGQVMILLHDWVTPIR